MESILIDRLRRGDPDAAQTLVDQWLDDVYRFLRHLTRNSQEAEDLALQTMLRAVRGAARFDGRSGIRTWLHAIAYREFLVWRRGRRLLLALDPRRGHVEKAYDAVLDRERLLQAIGRLSPKLSAAFLLVEIQELAHDEAADVLQTPIGTVKSRVHEARRRLRVLLEESDLPAEVSTHA